MCFNDIHLKCTLFHQLQQQTSNLLHLQLDLRNKEDVLSLSVYYSMRTVVNEHINQQEQNVTNIIILLIPQIHWWQNQSPGYHMAANPINSFSASFNMRLLYPSRQVGDLLVSLLVK